MWNNIGKLQLTTVASVPAGIQTGHLPNTRQIFLGCAKQLNYISRAATGWLLQRSVSGSFYCNHVTHCRFMHFASQRVQLTTQALLTNRTVPFPLKRALPSVRRWEQGPLTTAAEASTSRPAFRSVSRNWTQPTEFSKVTHVENEYLLRQYIP
jgi:hypothetical protein